MRPTRNEKESFIIKYFPLFSPLCCIEKIPESSQKKGRKKGDCGGGKVREERALVAVKKYEEEEEEDFYAESFPSQGGGREDLESILS